MLVRYNSLHFSGYYATLFDHVLCRGERLIAFAIKSRYDETRFCNRKSCDYAGHLTRERKAVCKIKHQLATLRGLASRKEQFIVLFILSSPQQSWIDSENFRIEYELSF